MKSRWTMVVLLAALGLGVAGCGDDDDDATGDGDADSDADADADADADSDSDSDADSDSDSDSDSDADSDCSPLPAAGGTVVLVGPDDAAGLPELIRNLAADTTVLFEDGTYLLDSGTSLQVVAPGVTLRSASDDRDAVVLDGAYATAEILQISASRATIAHLTIERAIDHPIHAFGGGAEDVVGVRLYDLRIVDGGEQFVKVNPNGDFTSYVDDGRLECSLLEMTAEGRTHVERGAAPCYTGGIDVHGGRGWIVRDNVIRDIYCDDGGLAEHGIHFWTGSRDTLVERNFIENCARGVGFGLVEDGQGRAYADDPYPGIGYVGHYDGIIRNNVIWATHAFFDTGIELAQARGARVHHNTVVSTATAFSSIDYRFGNTSVELRNNLVRRITQRDGASGIVEANLETDSEALFVDAAAGDFHLADGAAQAIDQGLVVDDAGLDLDGRAHDVGAPDIGADEHGAP